MHMRLTYQHIEYICQSLKDIVSRLEK
jgi:hypothetical protein